MSRTIALLLATTLPAAAIAQDAQVTASLTPLEEPTVQAAPAAPEIDWTGFSVGLGFGYVPDADDGDGFVYGGRVAYDYDFGDFIAGAFLDYGGSNIDFDNGTEVDSILRVGARGGFDSGLNWYYASAGYTEVETSGDNNPGDGDGYFLGLGYERFIGDALTLGAEIVYSDFDDFDDDTEVDATTFGLSVNYRF